MKKINKNDIILEKFMQNNNSYEYDILKRGNRFTDLRIADLINKGYLKSPVDDIIGLNVDLDLEHNMMQQYLYYEEPTIYNESDLREIYKKMGVVYIDEIKAVL